MSVQALQEFTFKSKYANWVESRKNRESWSEAVDRLMSTFEERYEGYGIEDVLSRVSKAVKRKEILASQRALQFGGKPVLKKNARAYNCVSSYVDRPKFFQECMYLLLCGCGTGFSVQKHHINKLPQISKPSLGKKTYIIPDTIEGWSDAVGIIVNSYFNNGAWPEYEGYEVEFDYSLIRPEGARISSGSGKAPGPEPLRKAIENIRSILNLATSEGSQLRPIHAYDIVMFFADAVISGGIRRSATICIFSPDDIEMMKAKTGNWFYTHPQRGRSNNSTILLRNQTTKEEFESIVQYTREFGEPGFIWADSLEFICNPCVGGDTSISTSDGLWLATDLLGKQFKASLNGKEFSSTDRGFLSTGYQDTLILEFSSGRKLEVTPNHNILTTTGWKEACELDQNDEIVINNQRRYLRIEENVDYCKGYLLGSFLGDGNESKGSDELLETCGWLDSRHKLVSESKSNYSTISSVKLLEFAKEKECYGEEKRLSKKGISGTWSYLSGLLAGYFDADGTVHVDAKKGNYLRYTSSQLENLENVQIALNAFGIYSKIYKNRRDAGLRMLPDGNGGMKEFYCEASHELHISCDNIEVFLDNIKIRNLDKLDKIKNILASRKRASNSTKFYDSIVSIEDNGKNDVYDVTIPVMAAFDANGVYVHNCVEIGMWAYLVVDETKYNEYVSKHGHYAPLECQPEEAGLASGWQGCNLSTENCGKIKTVLDYFRASKRAAEIGTLQSGLTDFPYLGPVTEGIFRRESLLGVSMTGIMECPDIVLNPKIQERAAKIIRKTNEKLAKKLGINPAARTTCVKPEGTASCVLGTSSGIHPHHAKRYIRRVQCNKQDIIYQHFKNTNPLACQPSVWSINETDDVIAFCIEVRDGAKLKNQVPAVEMLETVINTQKHWVMSGTNKDRCTKPWLVHNVSNTITVMDNEWGDVVDTIYNNREYFCGISLLSASGDKDYAQAPFSEIFTIKELIQMYGEAAIFASGLITEAKMLYEDNLWVACDAILGIVKSKGAAKSSFIERANKYATKYLDGDIKKLAYCLKDVDNYKYYTDLKREYKVVDYDLCIEEENNIKHEEVLSCAGGACEISFNKG